MSSTGLAKADEVIVVDDFDRADGLYHGHQWETLNPGFWKIEGGSLRRRLHNEGDWAQGGEFPFRTLLKGGQRSWPYDKPQRVLPPGYPPSLPFGMIWRRDYELTGNYTVTMEATILGLPPSPEQTEDSREYMPDYSVMGICFGGQSLLESWTGRGKVDASAWMALWRADGGLGIYSHASDGPDTAQEGSERQAVIPKAGEKVTISVAVSGDDESVATVSCKLIAGGQTYSVVCEDVDRRTFTEGYFGLVCRGLLDFRVDRVMLTPFDNTPAKAVVNDLHVCYPIGDTLREVDGKWHCRFVAMFRSDGEKAEIRVWDSPSPRGGWGKVPVAGAAEIISNDFRINTASIDVTLPFNPGRKTMYYTVFKDGADVTGDRRRDWLGRKDYVGRLPQLTAPYRIAGLGGHSIVGPADMEGIEKFEVNWIRGQPTREAFRYMEDFDFQICNWEDDVWYLEMVFAPVSVDDAYKIVNLTIANTTTRWQMMRHWNTINPGDHDFGMNDLRGPEQYAVRRYGDLGQDPEYLRRNYKMVQHLISGDENPSAEGNAKLWRRWKMPNGDFTYLIIDARSWRDSTETALYANYGWGHNETVYERDAPMRPLLGEEQFAWLSEIVRTDTSSLMCVTGINGLHTVWQGSSSFEPETGLNFNQRGRGSGDFAGWAKAGSDRVLRLLGGREGIVTVYGDVHCSGLMKNLEHRLYECSFGAIARNGSRGLKKGFGPWMFDYDLRPLEMVGLYHSSYDSPDLHKREGPKHWNFLEMQFDTRGDEPEFYCKIRNVIDSPGQLHRGGGFIEDTASNTGRPHTCSLPKIKTLANADVLFSSLGGHPIRGARSDADGNVPISGLIEIDGEDIPAGARVIMTAFDGVKTDCRVIETEPVNAKKLARFRENIQELQAEGKEQREQWIREYKAKN